MRDGLVLIATLITLSSGSGMPAADHRQRGFSRLCEVRGRSMAYRGCGRCAPASRKGPALGISPEARSLEKPALDCMHRAVRRALDD